MYGRDNGDRRQYSHPIESSVHTVAGKWISRRPCALDRRDVSRFQLFAVFRAENASGDR